MLKLAGIFCICLIAFPAFSQSASKWQEGTITEVKDSSGCRENWRFRRR